MSALKGSRQDDDYTSALGRFCHDVLSGHPEVEAYRNNYLGIHAKAIANNFPATAALTGFECLAALSRAYVRHYPPEHWDINGYGAQFPALLAAQRQGGRAGSFNWCLVARVAQLEYGIIQAYYADEPPGGQIQTWILDADDALEVDPALIPLLQDHHPYSAFSENLLIAEKILIWREKNRVCIANPSRD
jgi:hypothetical protein